MYPSELIRHIDHEVVTADYTDEQLLDVIEMLNNHTAILLAVVTNQGREGLVDYAVQVANASEEMPRDVELELDFAY